MTRRVFGLFCLAIAASLSLSPSSSIAATCGDDEPLLIVVMDPLCDKLACDCVQGYAQRKYETLAKYLLAKTGQHTQLAFGESLAAALEGVERVPDFVIGKYSVAMAGAQDRGLTLTPFAHLTGKDGSTTQTGLIVVRAADPAVVVDDLVGYHIIFGPADCDEKHRAAQELLTAAGVQIPAEVETAGACSEAARKLLDLPATTRAATVVSSYAQPLLEGCGTIKKGDLRVIGETRAVPFVTAFARADVPAAVRQAVAQALLEMGNDAAMLESLETARGFVPFDAADHAAPTSYSGPAPATKKK